MKKILLFILIILLFGLTACKKEEKQYYNDGLLLKSENKLYYSDLKSKMRLIDSNDVNPLNIRHVNNHLFYQTSFGGSVYHVNLKEKDEQAQALPSMYLYYIDNTGNLVTYINDDTIYQIDLSKGLDSKAIISNVRYYFVSSDGKKFLYRTGDEMYILDTSKKNSDPKLVLRQSVRKMYPASDLSFIAFITDDDDLYTYKYGKSAKLVDSNVMDIFVHDEIQKNFLYVVNDDINLTAYLKAYKNGKTITINNNYSMHAFNGICCYYSCDKELYYFDGSKSHLISTKFDKVDKAIWEENLSLVYVNTSGYCNLVYKKNYYSLGEYSNILTYYSENEKYLYYCIPGHNYLLERINLNSLFKRPKMIMNKEQNAGIVTIFVVGNEIFYIDSVSFRLFINGKEVGEINFLEIKECDKKYYYLYNGHLYCINNYKIQDLQGSINDYIIINDKLIVFKNTSDIKKGVCVVKGKSLITIGENVDNYYYINNYFHYW